MTSTPKYKKALTFSQPRNHNGRSGSQKLDYQRMRRFLPTALCLALTHSPTRADSIKPIQFGPYIQNSVGYIGNPASHRYVLNNGQYRLLVGWIEPISERSGGILKDAYFETDGDINVTPFQSDVGTTFNLKPIRYLEFGLSYSRLMFHNSLVTFSAPGAHMIDVRKARPGDLRKLDQEFGGADVFTFQTNLTLDMGPTQLHLLGSYAMWDIDVPGKDFVYEYSNDMVIKPRDRVASLLTRWNLDLSRYSRNPAWSYTGIGLRNQYWFTVRTEQEKNLVSAGITGLRLGRNPPGQRRGLDMSVGYWTMHPQIAGDDWERALTLLLEWKWNVQVLKL